jgi:hypothetical protein
MGKDFSEDCRGLCEISGFRREVHENCALLGYYTGSSGNFLLTFRDNLSVPSSMTLIVVACSKMLFQLNTEIQGKSLDSSFRKDCNPI